jgi:hypothetical protein
MTDTERIDFIAECVQENGPELYPVDADVEYAADGNTVVKVGPWHWFDGTGETFRDAIDDAMRKAVNEEPPK